MMKNLFFITLTFFKFLLIQITTKDLNIKLSNYSLNIPDKTLNFELIYKEFPMLIFKVLILSEINSSGSQIDYFGKKNHSVKLYNNLKFTAKDFINDTYSNVPCYTAVIKSDHLLKEASMDILVRFFNQTGKIERIDKTTQEVNQGTVLLSFKI